MNKWAPHPKREPHQLQRTALAQKQQSHLFIQSFLNIQQHLNPSPSTVKPSPKQHYPIADHLLSPAPEITILIAKNEKQSKENKRAVAFQDTTQTKEDEQSEYQSYLKQYSTVVKNSRKKQFISPQAQKEEMDELITQFLSGVPTQQQQLAQRKRTSQQNGQKKKRECQEDPSVRVEKIDLNHRKPKSTKKNHLKDERSTEEKKGSTPIKLINVSRYQKEDRHQPRLVSTDKSEQKSKKIVKTPKTIQVIKIFDTREKKEVPSIHVNLPKQQGKETENFNKINPNNYSIAHRQSQKESYLKNNLHKTMNKSKQSPEPIPYIQHSQKVSNESSRIHKKPIKIQIQIPLEDSQEPLDVIQNTKDIQIQSSRAFSEQRQIIKQVSQKVLALIEKNKHFTPVKKPL